MTLGLLRLFLDDFVYRFWIRPDDALSWSAVLLAVMLALFAFAPRRWHEALVDVKRPVFLAATSLTALLLSYGYVTSFLRGGPRIVDGTSYFLSARSIAGGHFTWPMDLPSASFRGRFLLAEDGHIGAIFPPGYPLLLSVGFLLGAPMAVGPLLAAAHVLATYELARSLPHDPSPASVEATARGAALLSVFSAGLRYHTADTMSHGATGLAILLSLTALFRARRDSSGRAFAWAGLFAGLTISTRMVSSFSLLLIAAIVLVASPARRRGAIQFAFGLLPGALLLLASQWAVTGSPFRSTQLAYYAVSDGPPGCFRYGFGKGIGCVFEHGDFVEHRLKNGHTLGEALETTAFRLKFHMADALNVEILAVALLPFVVLRSLFRVETALLALLVVAHVGAYLPFYFDGSYPGGGGRFYADILSVELALVAATMHFRRFPTVTTRLLVLVAALMCAGFGTRSIVEHRKLRDRDGGLPAFLPKLAPDTGLLFVDSDAAFGLAFQPRNERLHVARFRGDAHDFVLYERLGRPPTYHYEFADAPKVSPFVPPESHRFESETDWPPLAQSGGYAIPFWPGCASDQRGLVAIPTSGADVTAELELPIGTTGRYRITPRIVDRAAKALGTLTLVAPSGAPLATWSWKDGEAEECRTLRDEDLTLDRGAYRLVLRGHGGEIALDAVDAVPLP